jgi:hypothetical protein
MKRLIGLLLIVATAQCYSPESQRDRKLLQFLDSNKAFLNWQSNWREMLPRFSLSRLKFEREDTIKLRELGRFSFQMLQRQLSFVFFCPNGSRGVFPFGFGGVGKINGRYELALDDSNPLLLYDLKKWKTYEFLFVGLYGPAFDGFAWLNDDLAIVASALWALGEPDMVRPAILIIDFKKMRIRYCAGEQIEANTYYKKRKHRIVLEPFLMLDYGR